MFASRRTSAALTQHSPLNHHPGGHTNRFHGVQHGDAIAAGISSEGDGSFMTDDTFAQAAKAPIHFSSKPSKHETKWRSLSEAILKNNSWTSIRRLIDRLPKEIEEIYMRLESNISKDEDKLSEDVKKAIYKEFVKSSSTTFGELHVWEVEVLLQMDALKSAFDVDTTNLTEFNRLIKDMMSKKVAASSGSKDREPIYDFEQFASLVYDLMHQRHKLCRQDKQPRLLSQYIPIDPDYILKQAWDVFIMVLLVYCSFEVPYTMAFTNSDDGIVPRTPFEVPHDTAPPPHPHPPPLSLLLRLLMRCHAPQRPHRALPVRATIGVPHRRPIPRLSPELPTVGARGH
jgi:hypothetical protein